MTDGFQSFRRRLRALPLFAAAVAAQFVLAGAAAARADQPAATPTFEAGIEPIFTKYCTGCHNKQDHDGKLSLEDFASLEKGGKHGAAVVPGKSGESRMWLALVGKIEPKMPPEDNEAPSAGEIEIIRRWIDAGAKGPTGPKTAKVLVTPKIAPAPGLREQVTALALSPKGNVLAVGRYSTVELLTADERTPLRAMAGHRGRVNAVNFFAGGDQLLAASGEPGLSGEVKLWDVATGTLVRTFEGHSDNVYAAVPSPDGKLLATSSYDQQIKLWDIATGRELRTLSGHNDAVYDLAFRPDGQILASASGDRTVKLWNVATGERLDTLSQPLKEQYAVAFSPDGRRLAAAGADNRIRMWDVSPDGKENTNSIAYAKFAHEGAVIKLAYTTDGQTLISAGEDRTIKLWNAATLTEKRALERQSDWVAALAASSDNKTLFVGRLDGSVASYSLETGGPVQPAPPELSSVSPRGVQIGATARLVLGGAHLGGVAAVQTSIAGAAVKVVSRSSNQVEVRVTVPADAPLGRAELWAEAPAGKTKHVDIHVDNLVQVAEREPNNTPSLAMSLTTPTDVWGTLEAVGDADCYHFEGRAGQQVVCELTAASIGSKLRAMVTLLDEKGRAVPGEDARAGDPLVAYRIPADGRYTVRVADQELAGSAEHFYRLAIGPLPYAAAVYPLGIAAGRASEVEVLGFNLPANFRVKVPASKLGEATVPLDPRQARQARPLTVAVSDLPEYLEHEPNDTPATATQIAAPCTAEGRLAVVAPTKAPAAEAAADEAPVPDQDLYRFESKAGQTWMIETEAMMRRSLADTVIEVLYEDGKPVERLLLEATRDSTVTFRPIDSTQADVRLTNWEEMDLNDYVYLNGEVVKLFRAPQGPDSGFRFYQTTFSDARKNYFDTAPTAHAVDEPCYVVEPHPPGARLPVTGLPVFTLYYTNDDESERRLGTDSRLTFTAPRDGVYLVRVRDSRGASDERFLYRLTIRRPKPDFVIKVRGSDPTVPAGGGHSIGFSINRLDGFDGEVKLDIAGLPPGFHISTPVTIQAGHREAMAVLYADSAAPQPADATATVSTVRATATIAGREVVKNVGSLGRIGLSPKAKLLVRMEPAELVIAPGTRVPATIVVERNGFDDVVTFLVQNLPHGVIVDNIGLNGVLVRKGETHRQIFLTATAAVPETSRTCYAETIDTRDTKDLKGLQASPPIMLHVRKPSPLAQAK